MRGFAALLVVLAVATTALAHQGVKNPGVMARMNAMLAVGKAMDQLKDFATQKLAYDPALADQSKAAILDHLRKSEALFKEPHQDPKSEALPVIWQDWRGYRKALRASEKAVRQLDISTLESLRATLPAAGQGCSDCHKVFRLKK